VAVSDSFGPEHPFPAAVDDAEAVTARCWLTIRAERIGLIWNVGWRLPLRSAPREVASHWIPLPRALSLHMGTADPQPQRRFRVFFPTPWRSIDG